MRAVFFATVLLLGCSRARVADGPINTQLKRSVDVTGDGRPETITLFLKASNYRTPFQWLLTIDSAGRTVFDYDSDDSEVDALFDDRNALPGCPDYATCKEQYYFRNILENLVDSSFEPEDIPDSLYPAGRAYLSQCCSLFGPPADKILRDIETRLRERRAIVISVPLSPVEYGPRMVYAPQPGEFVPIDP